MQLSNTTSAYSRICRIKLKNIFRRHCLLRVNLRERSKSKGLRDFLYNQYALANRKNLLDLSLNAYEKQFLLLFHQKKKAFDELLDILYVYRALVLFPLD